MRRFPAPKKIYRRVAADPGKKPAGARDGWIGIVLERDDPEDRRSPGTMYVYGRQGYLGAFRSNENGFIGSSRGVPAGRYTLQPKRKSGTNWPAQTPAITGPGQPPGKPGPGYKADAILLHPEGRRGQPDSLSCITVNDEGFRRVMHIMHQAPDSIVPLIIR
ncbi:MAG: hypothetical protein FGM15_03475 [Chthoniobacterales bacterium]|nr:hypothetical protein [Chthoniobacterales bacterium]